MRTWTFLAVALLLAGCATAPQQNWNAIAAQDYVATNKPLAEAGTLKWSEYYKGAYRVAGAAGAHGTTLARLNEVIRDAEQYEAGTISKSEFEYRQRAARAQETSADQYRAAQARAEQAQLGAVQLAAGLQMMQASQPRTISQPAPSAPMVLMGFLQNQSVNGLLRYCRYSNGVVNTISSTDLCPLNTGQ